MNLHGRHLLGSERSALGTSTYTGVDPTTGSALDPIYTDATSDEIEQAVALAQAAHPAFEQAGRARRADLLERIADEIETLGDTLLARMHAETALPLARAAGERGRTVGQLRGFATLVRDGSWLDPRIDRAQPERQPLPKPDVRSLQRALGPVAGFGASNFPLAFSVAGGDTASALAAGCPVVVKGHPAHPGTSELLGEAIARAVAALRLPAGVFSLLHGAGHEVGERLVAHPGIRAVGFTGSLRGGRALFDLAARRPEPIPVYAEMGSVNPVFLLPAAVEARGNAIAASLAASVTNGVGQFCTNPGVVVMHTGVAPHSGSHDRFLDALADHLRDAAAGVMLHRGIADAYRTGLARLAEHEDVETLVPTRALDGETAEVYPAALVTDAAAFIQDEALREEVFGPVTLVVRCTSLAEMLDVARAVPGQLTATVHHEDDELQQHGELLDLLGQRVGRLVFNGFPTGVEVCPAMVHGGPYPATTVASSTSVGSAAIARFLRPVAYQDAPPEVLPAELRDANPEGLLRLVDGEFTRRSLE